MKIVIIEDEKPTAKDLARTIVNLEVGAEIVEILYSVEEAINYLSANKNCDLIFSDIQLGDGLSFEIFEAVKNTTPIVFCTAYNEYALNAFNAAGIDYLLKPFSKATVARAIEKYQNLKAKLSVNQQDYSAVLNVIKHQLQPTKMPSVLVHQGDKIIPVEGSEVAYFYIENGLVFAQTFQQKNVIVNQQLDKLEELFSTYFFRANRQFLINRKAVKEASHHFNRKVQVHLTIPCKEQVMVGKLKVSSFLEWLAQG
jgi:two-component system, LytTR family, response regulator LytT